MRQAAITTTCIGEAHSNLHIDNCAICQPYWGKYPSCPVDGKKLSITGWCSKCRKHFSITSRLSGVKGKQPPKAE